MRLGKIAAVAAAAALVVAGCSSGEPQAPQSASANPSMVSAGITATNGPNKVETYGPQSTRTVQGSDGGEIDGIAISSLDDIEEFWNTAYSETFNGQFENVENFQSWDSTKQTGETFCGEETYEFVNAVFAVCDDGTHIGWDRGVLMHDLRKYLSDVGITAVLAHEYGHWIQYHSGIVNDSTPTIVSEQQADCLAGVYTRWVADGNSKRVTMSTGDGLNNVLSAMIAVRDGVGTEADANPQQEHGSAFDRVSAFQFGFEDGAPACKNITEREISQRRADLPQFLNTEESGEMDITEGSVSQLVDALEVVAPSDDPPTLKFGTEGCGGGATDTAVSYCPSDNTIVANLEALRDMTAMPEEGFFRGPAMGDTTAFSAVMSRYVMALEQQRNADLSGDQAGMRTACLTGAVITKFVEPVTTPDGNTLQLSAGDLDESVSGLLTYGVAASDVDGTPVPSGFARIEAFRDGVLGDADHCYDLYQ